MPSQIELFIRKFRSSIIRFGGVCTSLCAQFTVFGNPSVVIGKKCRFGKSVRFLSTDGGSISIGCNAYIGDNVQLVAQGGNLVIENDVFIGAGSVIVCLDQIAIGKDTLISEYVVIRDQDHKTDTRPVRSAGFLKTPILIGQDVWIGCKSSILRGARVGDRCVVGAHSLVRTHIPDDTLAVGVPARAVRRIEERQNQ